MKKRFDGLDDFLLRVLEGIRFSPSGPDDCLTSGIHQTGGLGGIGYTYWKSARTMCIHQNLEVLRRASNCDLSFSEANAIVSRFISKFVNPLVAGQFGWQTGTGTLLSCLSGGQIATLKQHFREEVVNAETETFYWFPLNSVDGVEFHGAGLILSKIPIADHIPNTQLIDFLDKPILKDAKVYLGVKARGRERATERASAFLGSLFLCMFSETQFTHVMASPAEGILHFDRNLSISSSRKHIPFLSNPIRLETSDLKWIKRVEEVILGGPKDRKLNRALRWLHASWFTFGAERFTLICQAADALTPSSASMMSAKCNWIHQNLSPKIDIRPIELIFKKIRSDVMHGDAPSLIESKSYVEFHSIYGMDPMTAAVEIVRKLIIDQFLPEMIVQPHPLSAYQEALDQQRQIFARYGLPYELKSGFDFSPLM